MIKNSSDQLHLSAAKPFVPWLGFILLSSLVAVQLSVHWNWSLLMDDYRYRQMIVDSHQTISQLIYENAKSFFDIGRFVPLYSATLMPLYKGTVESSSLLHGFTTLLFLFILFLVFSVVEKESALDRRRSGFAAGVTVLVLFCYRQIFDIAGLVSIPESWVVIFVLLGWTQFPRRPWAYRILFLAAGLYKEPAYVAFLASALVILRFRRKQAFIDFLMFLILGVAIQQFKKHGPLGSASPLSLDGFRHFSLGFAKLAAGFAPIIILISRKSFSFISLKTKSSVLWFLIFAILYLAATSIVEPVGYRLIPSAVGIAIASIILILDPWKRHFEAQRWALFSCVAFILSATSLYRYQKATNGIQESSATMQSLLATQTHSVFVVQGEELRNTMREIVDRGKSGSVVVLANEKPLSQPSPGSQIILLENCSYFGNYPNAVIERWKVLAGGWQFILDRGSYRVYFGNVPKS